MDASALERRNLAISESKTGGEKLAKLIRGKLGLSLNAYADRIGIAAGSLSNYRTGKWPCPRWVADRVKADTGFTAWPAGVVDKAR